MDYNLISKLSVEELKNYFRIRGLKVKVRKKELMAKVFATSENGLKPIKTAVEIEADFKPDYVAKLKIDDRHIPDPFQDEGMKFWSTLLYLGIFIYSMLLPSVFAW